MAILPKTINQTTGEPSWRWRRIAFFLVLLFCIYRLDGMVDKIDSELNQIIATGLMWLLAALSMIYMGFATAQDIVAMFISRSARPYADPVPAVNTVETKTETKSVVVTPEPPKTVEPDPNAPPPGYAP